MLSIRWRLTIFHALVILAITTSLLGIFLIATIRGVTTSVEGTVRARAAEATRLLESQPLPDDEALASLTEGNVFIVIRDGQGQVLARTGNPSPGIGEVRQDERESIWREVLATGQPVSQKPRELYVYAVPLSTDFSDARVIEAWKSYDATAEDIIPFVPVVSIAIPAGLVLAIIGSYLLARSALSPVNAIVRAAREIGERDLSRRLPVNRPRDELGQLASTFNDLLARLEVAFRQREETLERQRQFVADASHELRTPLTSIRGYARMLRQWALDDPEAARESVAAIEREAARMSELVERLLRLARGDEGMPLDLVEHDLREVAASAAAAAQAAADGHASVIYDSPAAPVIATFDQDRIREIADILLDNALKYSREGGRVTVAVRKSDGWVELMVSDNGIGILPEHLPHVFDRFYRADESRSDGGTGLGLAIARQIAAQHGGAIEAASAVGSGSTFTLRLPAVASPKPSTAPRSDDGLPAR